MIMHAICRRHAPRRMKYQPVEIKIVLTRLNVALRAGRSEVEITLKRLNRLGVKLVYPSDASTI